MNRVILSPEYFGNPTIGRPISNADIYVGIVDLDPTILANQKQISVQQENGTIVEVAQPVSTGAGGYPLHNGSSVTILVEGNYSLKVLDKQGAQVYYVPSQSDFVSTNEVNDMLGLTDITGSIDGDIANMAGFFVEFPQESFDGGGMFVWQADLNKNLADGGIVVDPATTGGFDGTISTRDAFLSAQGTGIGTGCWVRKTEAVSPSIYGAIGGAVDLTAEDDTNAVQAALDSDLPVLFTSSYGVTTVTISGSANHVDFMGFGLIGVATEATDCVCKLEIEGSYISNYWVNQFWNENYICGTQWYDDAASSQFNFISGMKHTYGRRGFVYGELPGNTSTGFAQSENTISGFTTRGIQNACFLNHENGVLFFNSPIFSAGDEEWAAFAPELTFDHTAARAVECASNLTVVNGGEIQKAGSQLGYAAGLSNCRFIGTIIETAMPVQIVGSEVYMTNCRNLNTIATNSQYELESSVSGARIQFQGCRFERPTPMGSFSSDVLVDASLAADTNIIKLIDCNIEEWRVSGLAGYVPLVKGSKLRIKNTELLQTAGAVISTLDDTVNILPPNTNANSTTLKGWFLSLFFGGGTTMLMDADAPAGFLQQSIQLIATGVARALNADETSAATILATAIPTSVGETFLVDAYVKITSGDGSIVARYYDENGAVIVTAPADGNGDAIFVDSTVIGIGAGWGNFSVVSPTTPATAAFVSFGIMGNISTINLSKICVSRA